VTWLDWGDYLDGQLTFRCLIRRDPKLVALREAIESGEASPEIAPYVPRAGHCPHEAFEHTGYSAAFDGDRAAEASGRRRASATRETEAG